MITVGSNVKHVSLSSALFASLVGLVLLYLVPHRARTKQILLESRQDDRFSSELRVIARASKNNGPNKAKNTTPMRGEITAESSHYGYVLTQTSPPETTMMRRPNVVADRMAAQNAAERQRRQEQLARRAAAARRRLVLTVVLLLATLSGGIAAAVAPVSVLLAVVPAALLASVLVLGRRAVVLNARADARYSRLEQARAEDLAAANEPDVATDTESESDESSAVVEAEPVEVNDDAPKQVETETWTPVPVPAPTYTLKPAAPRWEPAPLDLPERDYLAPSARNEQIEEAPSQETKTEVAPAAGNEAEMDLDAILDRRRAAGA